MRKFSKKLFAFYSILGILAISSVFAIYYSYRTKMYEREYFADAQARLKQVSSQINTMLEKMEFGISLSISGDSMLDSMEVLADVEGHSNFEVSSAVNTIKRGLSTWYATKNYYQTIVFNYGGIAVSGSGIMDSQETERILEEEEYENRTAENNAEYYIWGPHRDPWMKEGHEVVSIIKKIVGYGETYIEIQYDLEELKELWGEQFFVLDKYNRILYNCWKDEAGLIAGNTETKGNGNFHSTLSGDYYIVTYQSEARGITVGLLADNSILRRSTAKLILPGIIVTGSILVVVLMYIYYSARYLAKPVSRLDQIIKSYNYENMNHELKFTSDIEELNSLSDSFSHLLQRLSASMEKEKDAVKLQMQAQFDALQAGVNPHFIFNVLNIIANRGMQLEDDEICRICSKLASILRYSSNTKVRYARLGEEFQYLNNYFYLIKARFSDDFDYSIEADERLLEMEIPKLGLQQLAENCVKFRPAERPVRIEIKVTSDESGIEMVIQDNGDGFEEEVIERLNHRISKIKERQRLDHESELGGMGIINTFQRFYYMYGERLSFEIDNNQTGACVLIKIEHEEEIFRV